jgi:hypothetical protein
VVTNLYLCSFILRVQENQQCSTASLAILSWYVLTVSVRMEIKSEHCERDFCATSWRVVMSTHSG